MNVSNRLMPWVFPLILAVLMGGVTFWLNRATDINLETTLLDINQPQYVMEGIEGTRFDVDGAKVESLVAESASMYPNSEDVVLMKPDARTFVKGQALYHVTSENARYLNQHEQIFFEKEVVFIKSSLDGKPEGKVVTSELTVDIPTQTARTEQNVEYQYGQSQGSAVGFSYDKKNDVLQLQSRVKAIIYDEQP